MHIFLTGMMGSGKSVVGKALSKQLGYVFIDLDKEIETKSGKNISSIFSEDGEDSFREKETKTAFELNLKQPSVIATGGGFPLKESNRIWMKKLGKVIWLKASPKVILERIKNEDRPLLPKPIDPGRITEILNTRIPIYEQADLVIETDNLSAAEAVNDIIGKLQ